MAATPARGSAPNPERPRLSQEIERQLEPADRRSAEGYAAVEQAIEKIDRLLEDGGVESAIDPSDTLMHTVEAVRKAAARNPEDE
jgi:hypothetical protein